jgi:hypothetical protein
MSLFMNLRIYKLIWKENGKLKSMNPLSLNEAFNKEFSLLKNGINREDMGIYVIKKLSKI